MKTFNVPVDNAMFMEHVDRRRDLLAVEADDVFLQTQSRHFLQRPLVTVLHKDIHLLLQEQTTESMMNKPKLLSRH